MSKTSKIAMSLVIVGAVCIVALVVVLSALSSKVTREVQDRMNDKLAVVSKMISASDTDEFSFTPFQCGGFIDYSCKSPKFTFSTTDKSITFTDVSIVAKDVNVRRRLEVSVSSNLQYSDSSSGELSKSVIPHRFDVVFTFDNDKSPERNDLLNVLMVANAYSEFNNAKLTLDSTLSLEKSDKNVNAVLLDLLNQIQTDIDSLDSMPIVINHMRFSNAVNKSITSIIDSMSSVDENGRQDMKQTLAVLSNIFSVALSIKLSPLFDDTQRIVDYINILSRGGVSSIDLHLDKNDALRPVNLLRFIELFTDDDVDSALYNVSNNYTLKVRLDEQN